MILFCLWTYKSAHVDIRLSFKNANMKNNWDIYRNFFNFDRHLFFFIFLLKIVNFNNNNETAIVPIRIVWSDWVGVNIRIGKVITWNRFEQLNDKTCLFYVLFSKFTEPFKLNINCHQSCNDVYLFALEIDFIFKYRLEASNIVVLI